MKEPELREIIRACIKDLSFKPKGVNPTPSEPTIPIKIPAEKVAPEKPLPPKASLTKPVVNKTQNLTQKTKEKGGYEKWL